MDGAQATSYLTKEIRTELVHGATIEITNRYHGLATELVNLVSMQFSHLIIVFKQSQPHRLIVPSLKVVVPFLKQFLL